MAKRRSEPEEWPAGVVITGGAGGVGEMVALRILEQAGRVAIADLSREAIASCRVKFSNFGRRAMGVELDVTDRSEVRRVFEDLWTRLGGFQIVVNCAGGERTSAALQLPESEWDEVLA